MLLGRTKYTDFVVRRQGSLGDLDIPKWQPTQHTMAGEWAPGCGRIAAVYTGGVPCMKNPSTNAPPFERSSKRRKGYPSETKVKRGSRIVHGDKELREKLGRNDLCPCGSGRCF